MRYDSDNPAHDSLDALLSSAEWPDDAADPLDRALRMALWPEPADSPLPDLRLLDRRKRRRRVLAAIGTAAAAVVLAAAAIRAVRDAGNPADGGFRTPRALPVVSAASDKTGIVSRPLPPREVRLRMILEQVRKETAAEDAALDRIIARRIAEPSGDLEELAQPLIARRSDYEQRLLQGFGRFIGQREPAAVELVGCLGSETSIPLLLRERLKTETHAAAVRALLNLADARTLTRLAYKEWDPGLRDEIAAELQSREEKQTTASTFIFEKGDQSCLDFRPDSSSQSELF